MIVLTVPAWLYIASSFYYYISWTVLYIVTITSVGTQVHKNVHERVRVQICTVDVQVCTYIDLVVQGQCLP